MTLNINQFSQTTVAGQTDLSFAGSVVTAHVSASQATALVAGQAVKIENSAGGIPNVLGTASNTDTPWGIVLRNLKDASFPALAALEVGRDNTVVYLTASGAIARGAAVEIDATTFKVSASGGVNPIIGEAYDLAVNNGDLIRVWLKLPLATATAGIKVVDVVATTAQINAGLVLIPGATGKSIRLLNFVARVAGAFASGTSVELESDATAAAVATFLEAALTNGAILVPGTANVTLGTDFANPGPSGEGLKLVNNGSAQTVGTSIEFTLTYQQN